jgi:hypothetical protein
MEQAEIDKVAHRIYRETATFYDQLKGDLGEAALGFKILYGPPTMRAPIIFVGLQPGGGPEDRDRETESGAHESWPKACEYATASWKLARNMQGMFSVEFLTECAGLNAIFLRAKSKSIYAKTVTSEIRRQVLDFSIVRTTELIECIEPKSIVFIGLESLRPFSDTVPALYSEEHRCLVERGQFAGRDAIAVMHLSGAQISGVDRTKIAKFVMEASAPPVRA